MYTKVKQFVKSSKPSPENYMKGSDNKNNSLLLYKLDNYEDLSYYTITKYEHRIDLISMELYDTAEYSWILLYLNKISIADLTLDRVIYYIKLSDLKQLINSI